MKRTRSLKKLTPLDTQIAEYLSRHYEELVFENVTSISHKTGASKATVVRFISKLGYNNFGELQRELRQDALMKRGSITKRYTLKKKQLKGDQEDIIEKNFAYIIKSLQLTHNQIDQQDFLKAARMIIEAKGNLFITGQRTSYAMAYIFQIMMKRIRPNSFLLDPHSSLTPDAIADVNSDDILFAIFRHPYAKQTSFIVQHCADQGVPVILLSDSEFSPLADLAQVQIIVASEEFSLFQSCTAVAAVLETLHIAALQFCDDSIYDRLHFTENLYRDFEIFFSDKGLNKMSSSYAKALEKTTREKKEDRKN
ncbi:MAG: MurR/RpiR family transcriptional regulator [Thermodesulfobacteriota bacterium]|nr:MurR/RpiR family transcriptional regulator [Thermodesulfobacteriota bacterium]